MYDKIVRLENIIDYEAWIRENGYSILSPRHRGIYAEMIFRKYCLKNGITVIKINPFFNISDQIPAYFLKKIQQKELKKLGKIYFQFFCYGKEKGFFAAIKMGTGNLNAKEKTALNGMVKNKAYLFRIFEDAEIFIRKLR